MIEHDVISAQEPTQQKRTGINNMPMVDISLSELFYRILENLWFVILLAALTTAAMAVYTVKFVTPKYQATAKLYVVNSNESVVNLSDLQIGSYLANDYQEIFKAWEVHELVIENLDLPYSYSQMQQMLKVSNPSSTRILYLTVTSADPEEAQLIANEYASVAKTYISEHMSTDQPVTLSIALTPSRRSSPNLTMNILIGFVVGAVAALGIIIISFLLDDKLKNANDVEYYTGLTVLAIVPAADKKTSGKSGKSGKKGGKS